MGKNVLGSMLRCLLVGVLFAWQREREEGMDGREDKNREEASLLQGGNDCIITSQVSPPPPTPNYSDNFEIQYCILFPLMQELPTLGSAAVRVCV